MTPGSISFELSPLFDQMAESVAVYERDGTIVYVNPVTCRLFGKPRDELVGEQLWGLFPSAIGGTFHQVFERVAATEKAEHFENYYEPWDSWFANSVYVAQGRVWVLARDISEQKRSADRLEILAQASRAFARAAADTSTLFDVVARTVAELLRDGCVIRLLSADEEVFEPPVGVWHTDPAVLELLRQAPDAASQEGAGGEVLRTGKSLVLAEVDPVTVADRIAPPERREFARQLGIHSVMIVPLKAQGKVLGLLSCIRLAAGTRQAYASADLRLAEELADRAALVVENWRSLRLLQLREERLRQLVEGLERWQHVFENASWGMSLATSDNRFIAVNRAFAEMHGTTADEWKGRSLLDMFDDESKARLPQLAAQVHETGQLVYESTHKRKDGSTFPVLTEVSAFKDDAGNVVFRAACFQDITQRRRHESELEKAIAVRDEFLAIAAHELRTPLTALTLQLGSLQAVAARGALVSGDAGSRKLEKALAQAARVNTLIGTLLDVSRLGSQGIQLQLAQLNWSELVSEACERLSEAAARAGSRIQLEASQLPQGVGDRIRLEQALTNLLSNAVKYGAGQDIHVTAWATEEAVRIDVRDHGIGIAAADRERIFGRFERAVSAEHYGGLGLGLFIADQIIAAHGGLIAVQSERGAGSTFSVSVPLQPGS